MNRLFSNTVIFTILSLLLTVSCNKEDAISINNEDKLFIRAIIDSSLISTKTQHSYINKKLKTSWKSGDEVAIYVNGRLYKAVQTGPITDNGHSSLFVIKDEPFLASGDEFEGCHAFYPYEYNPYSVAGRHNAINYANQTGKIEDLNYTDALIAKGEGLIESDGSIKSFVFSPMCSILRLPKDNFSYDNDWSGTITFTLSGDNVAKLRINDFEVTDPDSGIKITTTLINGKLQEDLYISFVPKNTQNEYVYYLDSDKGHHFEFYHNGLDLFKFYTINTANHGFVEFGSQLFKDYCLNLADINKDGEISYAEAQTVKEINYINPKNEQIRLGKDFFKGIEHFKNINSFQLADNYRHSQMYIVYDDTIRCLDFRGFDNLKTIIIKEANVLNINANNLPSLENVDISLIVSVPTPNGLANSYPIMYDFTDCKSLNSLVLDVSNAYNTYIGESLKMKGCNSLKKLHLGTFHVLDIDNNCMFSELTELQCKRTQIQFDISKSSKLTKLYLSETNIVTSKLDVQAFPNLQELYCSNDQTLEQLIASNCQSLKTITLIYNPLIKELDLHGCTGLTSAYCFKNEQLSNLNLSGCVSLDSLICNRSSQLTSINLKGLPSLKYFDCSFNELSTLDISDCTSLEYIDFSENPLTTINIKGSSSLKNLYFHNTQLTNLDVSGCTALTNISCTDNPLVTLNVSGCTSLSSIYCRNDQLTTLDICGCTALNALDVLNNQLTTLDVRDCASLVLLNCSNNQLTSLDISRCTALTSINCSNNQLTSLDVSRCVLLGSLDCSINQISNINLSNNNALKILKCNDNLLTYLILEENLSNLGRIYCENNLISGLDISKLSALTYLSAWPQTPKLNKLWIKKGMNTTFYSNTTKINPSDYGTEIIEVE